MMEMIVMLESGPDDGRLDIKTCADRFRRASDSLIQWISGWAANTNHAQAHWNELGVTT